MSKRGELYDVQLVVHRETEKAVLVSEAGDPDDAVWLPKSQVEMYEEVGRHKFWPIHQFSMPQWLAEEKELV